MEIYPVNYPSGHAICQDQKDKCFQFEYEFDQGAAKITGDFLPVERTWRRDQEGKGIMIQPGAAWEDGDIIMLDSVSYLVELSEGRLTLKHIGSAKAEYHEDEGLPVTKEYVLKPYPNEHACRLRDPDDFQEGTFRRYKRESDGKEYFVIAGKLKGETKMTEQAFRYPKDGWTVAQARKHCKAHDGIEFEPAGESAAAADPDEAFERRVTAILERALRSRHVTVPHYAIEDPGKTVIRVVREESAVDIRKDGAILKLKTEPDGKPGEK